MSAPHAPDLADPTIAIAERQLAMLSDMALIATEVSRGYTAAALASARAVEVILADEYWQPETGRARALAGARDAADGFQKVSRVMRLTFRLQMTTAETLRDLRAGIVPAGPAAVQTRVDFGGTPPDPAATLVHWRPAGFSSGDEVLDFDPADHDSERLVEFDRPDRLPGGAFRETVGSLCAEIGVAADWTEWNAGRPALKYQPLPPRPPGRGECHPPERNPRSDHSDPADRAEHPPP